MPAGDSGSWAPGQCFFRSEGIVGQKATGVGTLERYSVKDLININKFRIQEDITLDL